MSNPSRPEADKDSDLGLGEGVRGLARLRDGGCKLVEPLSVGLLREVHLGGCMGIHSRITSALHKTNYKI